MTKKELIKKYEQQKFVLEKRMYNLMQRFQRISNVPIEKADINQEENLTNKMWWLKTRIKELENKIETLEATIPQKIFKATNNLIDSIITNFAGGIR